MGSNLSNWYFRIGMLWLLAGVGLGIYMAASHDHTLFPAHAHMNLLGWVTMGVFAFFYRLWPQAATTKLARIQFWIYVPTHLVAMAGLAALLRGNAGIEPLVAVSSIVLAISVLLFVVNAWKHTASPATATQPVGTAAAS